MCHASVRQWQLALSTEAEEHFCFFGLPIQGSSYEGATRVNEWASASASSISLPHGLQRDWAPDGGMLLVGWSCQSWLMTKQLELTD